MSNRPMVRLVKVGGSLFDLPDLPDRLRAWMAEQSLAHHVLVAGGGAFCDLVRANHGIQPLEEETAHWMCVDLMSVTARLLQSWLPEITLIDTDRQLCQQLAKPGATIFDAAKWLRDAEPALPGVALGFGWDVTSDAIAGRLAVALLAEELVILKSRSSKVGNSDLEALAAEGYVDRMLPRLAGELPPVRFVNLRGQEPNISLLRID